MDLVFIVNLNRVMYALILSGYKVSPKDSLNTYKNTYVIRTSIRGGNTKAVKKRT